MATLIFNFDDIWLIGSVLSDIIDIVFMHRQWMYTKTAHRQFICGCVYWYDDSDRFRYVYVGWVDDGGVPWPASSSKWLFQLNATISAIICAFVAFIQLHTTLRQRHAHSAFLEYINDRLIVSIWAMSWLPVAVCWWTMHHQPTWSLLSWHPNSSWTAAMMWTWPTLLVHLFLILCPKWMSEVAESVVRLEDTIYPLKGA